MRQILTTIFCSILCLFIGLAAGIGFAPQLKATQPVRVVSDILTRANGAKAASDENSPYEMYDYPTIKWKPKALADAPGALAQLWTKFEANPQNPETGKVNYRLTLYKVPDKGSCEVQVLDETGFKLLQFNATDFFKTPGAPNITEARESFPCTEEEYRKMQDYSIK